MTARTPGETSRETPDDIQKQIDNAREHVDAAINAANNAINALMDAIYDIARTRQENTTTVTASDEPDSEGFWHDTPDSEGFWRDIDDDVWACDNDGNARLIVKGHQTDDDHSEIYNLSYNYQPHGNGPFTKIDNPFLKRADHAD